MWRVRKHKYVLLTILMISSISIFMMLASFASSSSSSSPLSSSKASYRGSLDKQIETSPHRISFETATASVRGNLGPASVIVSSSTKDWLRDRWQAAKDMTGAPIPGPHFVLLSAVTSFTVISRVTIDWETASASNIQISAILSGGSSKVIYKYGDKRERSKKPKHVIDSFPIDFKSPDMEKIVQIRIDIVSPETIWGSSIWYVEIWGF